jgi:hypothetical protein
MQDKSSSTTPMKETRSLWMLISSKLTLKLKELAQRKKQLHNLPKRHPRRSRSKILIINRKTNLQLNKRRKPHLLRLQPLL